MDNQFDSNTTKRDHLGDKIYPGPFRDPNSFALELKPVATATQPDSSDKYLPPFMIDPTCTDLYPNPETVQIAKPNLFDQIYESYKRLHSFLKDDIVGNAFSNTGQLVGRWMKDLYEQDLRPTIITDGRFIRKQYLELSKELSAMQKEIEKP